MGAVCSSYMFTNSRPRWPVMEFAHFFSSLSTLCCIQAGHAASTLLRHGDQSSIKADRRARGLHCSKLPAGEIERAHALHKPMR